MFYAQCPSPADIDRFLEESPALSLSYGPVRVAVEAPRRNVDELVLPIGHGERDFERAKALLLAWTPFDIGWVELHPQGAPTRIGTVVAVLIRHFGFWSLNGCRVVYHTGGVGDEKRWGFAYGTLTNHAEAGEELFEVSLDPQTGEVRYRIRAFSRPRAPLAWIGYPIVRLLQARFRRDSAAAMRRAITSGRRAV
jgi:uncharacterized protein (UPF0548 family)